MSNIVLKIENVSKQYRLGLIGTGTISHDLNRWWHKIRGKEDPYIKIGDINHRDKKGGDYVWALNNINFEVNKGEVLGIIGKNGAGKSTILKLLSQVTNPTTGQIKVKGRIASLLEVGTGFHPELTGRENIYLNGAILGMVKAEISSKLDEIIDFSGVSKYIDTPVKRYSSGMMVRLGFAVAAHLEPEILVVDEVLAVGDADFQKKCIGKMKDISGYGRTVIFVSHNMTSIRNLCSKAIVLDKGQVTYSGSVENAIQIYLKKNDLNNLDSIKINIESANRKYSTGEAFYTQAYIINNKNKISNSFSFREKQKVILVLQVNEVLKNVILTLGLITQFGDNFAYSMSNDGFELNSFEKGVFKIEFEIPFYLMPGSYALTFAITNYHTGNAIDFIDYFSPFSVSKESNSSTSDYPWNTIHGKVEMRNNWNIIKEK